MADGNHSSASVDPLTGFWTDFMSRMGSVGMSTPPMSPEMLEQMREGFFGVLSKHADQFMRSEQFLKAMKSSMDNALAFRQQINAFLTKNLEDLQMPAASDIDGLVQAVREMEQRVTGKLDALAERLDRLEGANPKASKQPTGAGRSADEGKSVKKTKSKKTRRPSR